MLALIITALLAAATVALPTISAKGAKFFTSDGNQFYIKGVAYQLTPDDPLVSGDQCQLDATLMQELGANTIRVYHVDPTADHDACMTAFADAGIYVFLDLDTVGTYIIAEDPVWNETQASAYEKVMDTFHGYDNIAGFFVGNEVLTTGANSIAAPYVKAAGRDMKAYRDSKGYRKIPIGYSAADIAALRPNLQNYLACSDDFADSLDFFGLNAYEWCGDATYESSGYAELQKNASEYNIPIFFSETGCIVPPKRTFTDQAAILGPDMDGTWSGAIVYEWIEEANMYGLISYGPISADDAGSYSYSGTPTPITPDFTNLKSQWATLTPTGVSEAAYTPSLTAPTCPPFTSSVWLVSGDVVLPTLGQSYYAAGGSSTAGTAASKQTGSTTTTGSGGTGTGTASATSKSSSAAEKEIAVGFGMLALVGLSMFIGA